MNVFSKILAVVFAVATFGTATAQTQETAQQFPEDMKIGNFSYQAENFVTKSGAIFPLRKLRNMRGTQFVSIVTGKEYSSPDVQCHEALEFARENKEIAYFYPITATILECDHFAYNRSYSITVLRISPAITAAKIRAELEEKLLSGYANTPNIVTYQMPASRTDVVVSPQKKQ